jgi:hypothetical protein
LTVAKTNLWTARSELKDIWNLSNGKLSVEDQIQGVALLPAFRIRSFHGDNTGSNPVGDAKSNQRFTISFAETSQAQKAQLLPVLLTSFAASNLNKDVINFNAPECL